MSVTPDSSTGGLHLASTAIRHTERGVPLWLHLPTHPGHKTLGQLTGAPSLSSLAGERAFAS